MWEQENWAFPNPLEGRSQDQNPDDNTADGADFMAAFRYAVMSRLKPAKKPKRPDPAENRNRDGGYERMQKSIREKRRKAGFAA